MELLGAVLTDWGASPGYNCCIYSVSGEGTAARQHTAAHEHLGRALGVSQRDCGRRCEVDADPTRCAVHHLYARRDSRDEKPVLLKLIITSNRRKPNAHLEYRLDVGGSRAVEEIALRAVDSARVEDFLGVFKASFQFRVDEPVH